MPANLTIALIERDRANPTPAAHRSLRNLHATRVAVSRQAQFAAEPIRLARNGACVTAHHPRDLCESFADAHCRAGRTKAKLQDVYHPHRIPVQPICHGRTLDVPYYAASPFERRIDLYA